MRAQRVFITALLGIIVVLLMVQASLADDPRQVGVLICGSKVEFAKADSSTGLWPVKEEEGRLVTEFWNDSYLMWEILYLNEFDNDKIHVLYGDGKDYPANWRRYQAGRYELYSITDTSAYPSDVSNIFTWLAEGNPEQGIEAMTDEDLLFCWTFDHGATGSTFRILDSSEPEDPQAVGKCYSTTGPVWGFMRHLAKW